MLKRNEISCVNTKRTAPPTKKFIHNSTYCALEFINFKEAHPIQCVLLNVFTQHKVREWSTATGRPLYLPYSLPLTGQLSKFLWQPLFNAFFQCARSKICILEISFFSLTYHFSVSIKHILSNFTCMTCPSVSFGEKQITMIRLTGLSWIYRTAKFPEDANTISIFFSHNKFRNLDLLFSFHWSLRNLVRHSVVWCCKSKTVMQVFYAYYAWIDAFCLNVH